MIIFYLIHQAVDAAWRAGIRPKTIELGRAKSALWREACDKFKVAHPAKPGSYDPTLKFLGIPVTLDSRTPGITVG